MRWVYVIEGRLPGARKRQLLANLLVEDHLDDEVNFLLTRGVTGLVIKVEPEQAGRGRRLRCRMIPPRQAGGGWEMVYHRDDVARVKQAQKEGGESHGDD